MNAIIPEKRTDGRSSFMTLVAYIAVRDDKKDGAVLASDTPGSTSKKQKNAVFDRLVSYIERDPVTGHTPVVTEYDDGRSRLIAGDLSCETNCFSVETAATEMNIVAAQNTRVADPVLHYILSWREEDKPSDDVVFSCVEESLNKLGMAGHQYVAAIHRDTDNLHVHIAANRINPVTYKAATLSFSHEVLQRTCRELERKHRFTPDNGSWQWSPDNQLVRAPWRFKNAPQGAAKREIFSDKESLYHYAVREVRDDITRAIKGKKASWEYFHLMLHEKGLGLREHNGGLVIFDARRPDVLMVKASDVHPTLTRARLEPYYGQFAPAPVFDTFDPEDPDKSYAYSVSKTYNPDCHVRDLGARQERREARAAARLALKERYKDYRQSWRKPDLNVKARYAEISSACQARKAHIRLACRDPLLRKLMYRVAEFERMKAQAELRISMREMRQKLTESGGWKPLPYRKWVEQESLRGDVAALSQLRGWSYREKRQAKAASKDSRAEGAILCAAWDDSPVLDLPTHTAAVHRNGKIEYWRDGLPAVVDFGDRVVIYPGADGYDDTANYQAAAAIVGGKSGERVELAGDSGFVERVLNEGDRYNARATNSESFTVTDNNRSVQNRDYWLTQRVNYTESDEPRYEDNALPQLKRGNNWKPGE